MTATVLDRARKEAEKLGWTLEEFLAEWCLRGSQGLKAEWVDADTVAQRKAERAKAERVAGEEGGQPWFVQAGFDNPHEASNRLCHIGNFREFRNGQRIASEAPA